MYNQCTHVTTRERVVQRVREVYKRAVIHEDNGGGDYHTVNHYSSNERYYAVDVEQVRRGGGVARECERVRGVEDKIIGFAV